MICDSPSRIYHCALPFCPSSSWLCECYSSELSQEVKVVKGLELEWGMCSREVFFETQSWTLTTWKEVVAVGYASGNIIILDGITGSCVSVLSEHTGDVWALAFSFDGAFLVSGGCSNFVNLWDVQTGGIVKTFYGNTKPVYSVSISLDCAMIASGSADKTIRLWDTQTGECCCVIDGHNDIVRSVSFSPTNPQLLISAADDNTVRWWDIGGCQIGPAYNGHHVTFSPDGTHFISCVMVSSPNLRANATVQKSSSGAVVAQLHVPGRACPTWCFSPDSRYVACAAQCNIHIWDITGSDPHLIKIFTGTGIVTSLAFSFSLISLINGGPIKFWEIHNLLIDLAAANSESTSSDLVSVEPTRLQMNDGIATLGDRCYAFTSSFIWLPTNHSTRLWKNCTSLMDSVTADLESTPSTLASIQSVSLQTDDGLAISSDSAGVVKIWDISTGLCMVTFQIPAKSCGWADAQLRGDALVFVWYPYGLNHTSVTGEPHTHAARRNHSTWYSTKTEGIHIWSTERGELQTVGIPHDLIRDLRISGDGLKVFLLGDRHIQAWSVYTGEIVGEVSLEGQPCYNSLVVDGSRVWVHFHDSQTQGWDFGIPGSAPILLSNTSPDRLRLKFINGAEHPNPSPSRIEDTVTGKEVFRFHGRYVRPTSTHLDGQHLVAGYDSGEVLILNFNDVICQ